MPRKFIFGSEPFNQPGNSEDKSNRAFRLERARCRAPTTFFFSHCGMGAGFGGHLRLHAGLFCDGRDGFFTIDGSGQLADGAARNQFAVHG